MKSFSLPEFSVIREHEEFVWLHDRFVENEEFAGYIIPPSPPKPDFDSSREKLQRLTEGESNMTKEEFSKMKQELERYQQIDFFLFCYSSVNNLIQNKANIWLCSKRLYKCTRSS